MAEDDLRQRVAELEERVRRLEDEFDERARRIAEEAVNEFAQAGLDYVPERLRDAGDQQKQAPHEPS